MRLSLEVAWNEVVRLCRVRTVVLMLLALPLLIIFLLGNALESDLEPVGMSVAVEGGGPLGDAAERYLASPAVAGYVETQSRGSEEEVREDVRSGKADFGFGLTEDGVRYYPGQFSERNLIAESVLDRFVANANVRIAAAEAIPGLSGEAVEQSLAGVPASERVQIGTLVARNNTDYSNFSAVQYYSVAYLIMFLLYSGMSAAVGLTDEREKGTLLRLYSMPVSLNVLLFGKLMGSALFACLQATVIVGFTKTVYGVDWGGSYGAIALVCGLVSAAAIGFAIVVCSFVRSRRAIESIFSLAITGMTFVSGGMIADLGSGMRELGKFTINHWANEVLRLLMSGGTLGEGWREAFVLGAIAAAIVAAAMLRFRKAVALA
ncbi:ABC transporter permease [Cohnella cellulosilytica]|uniref:ABC transporter permease n=1 Tax=Cohnella cellulosilytica TaxID=986710 RepID=A0ABW2F7E9_9BACL